MSSKPDNDGLQPLDLGPEPTSEQPLRSFASLSDIWTPDQKQVKPERASDLGQSMVDAGIIKESQLAEVRAASARTPGKSLIVALLESGVDEEVIQKAVAQFREIDGAGQGISLKPVLFLHLKTGQGAESTLSGPAQTEFREWL